MCLEASMALVMNGLSLEMKQLSLSFGKLKTLKVSIHEGCYKVESMILMKLPKAVNAYPLLVIKTKEVKLLSMQATVDWDWLLLAEDWRLHFLRLRNVILVQVHIINLVVDIHVLMVHVLLILVERVVWIHAPKHLLVRVLHVNLARV